MNYIKYPELADCLQIEKVADCLRFLLLQEELYHCDYLADSVLKLHDSLNAIMPVLKRSGRIFFSDLELLNNAIKELSRCLVHVYTPEIYTVTMYSKCYSSMEAGLIGVLEACQYMKVLDLDDSSGYDLIISEARGCVSSILDCANLIKNLLFERLNSDHDYHRRIMELMRISKEFREMRISKEFREMRISKEFREMRISKEFREMRISKEFREEGTSNLTCGNSVSIDTN